MGLWANVLECFALKIRSESKGIFLGEDLRKVEPVIRTKRVSASFLTVVVLFLVSGVWSGSYEADLPGMS